MSQQEKDGALGRWPEDSRMRSEAVDEEEDDVSEEEFSDEEIEFGKFGEISVARYSRALTHRSTRIERSISGLVSRIYADIEDDDDFRGSVRETQSGRGVVREEVKTDSGRGFVKREIFQTDSGRPSEKEDGGEVGTRIAPTREEVQAKEKEEEAGGEDVPKEEAPKKAKQSFFLRLKKGFASRTINYRIGRKAISYMIGEAGSSILQNCASAAKKDQGEKFSRQMYKCFLKTMAKAKLLLDSGSMTVAMYHPVRMQSVRVLNALGSSLPSRDAPETPVDISISKVEDVSEMFSQFTVTLTLLYAPYFQNKNIVKLRNALNYCGSRHFLMLLVSDMNYEVERQALLEVAIKLQFLWETQHDQQQEDTVEDQEGKHAKPD